MLFDQVGVLNVLYDLEQFHNMFCLHHTHLLASGCVLIYSRGITKKNSLTNPTRCLHMFFFSSPTKTFQQLWLTTPRQEEGEENKNQENLFVLVSFFSVFK